MIGLRRLRLMGIRQLTGVTACAFVALWGSPFAMAAKPAASPARSGGGAGAAYSSPAARLVEAALIAEREGNVERRAKLLDEAVAADPTYAPARWHRGELRIGDEWIPAAVQRGSTEMANKVFEYNNRRAATGKSAAEQLALARWCKQQGLSARRRTHAILALKAEPRSQGAREELGLQPYAGVWLTAPEIKEIKVRSDRERSAFKKWKLELTRWLRSTQNKHEATRAAAQQRVRDVNDPAAITALERIFSVESESSARLAVAALDKMPQQAATESLIRHAVLPPWESVRRDAAEALGRRSLYSYAPLLLTGLQAPIQVQFAAVEEGVGSWTSRCILYREGPMVDTTLNWSAREQVKTEPITPTRTDTPLVNRELARVPQDLVQGFARATGTADALLDQVQAANKQTEFINRRITQTLQAATEKSDANPAENAVIDKETGEVIAPQDPRYWWQWWYDHNDIYYSGERQVTDYQQIEFIPPPVECFVAGTPVWTPTGPVAIDRLAAGDVVLAQHPETGEVAFKGVLTTTVRPPAKILKIQTEHGILSATRGHPLWVSGQGWRMARELKVGDRLHTLNGPKAILSIEPADDAEAYNLAVDGFNTYFAGDERILAHDNNLRQPTEVVVPGLPAE